MEQVTAQQSLSEEDLGQKEPEHYFTEKHEQMLRGEVVWVRRNFDGDSGLTIDLFNGLQLLGYVDVEDDNPNSPAAGFTAVAYLSGEDGPEPLEEAGSDAPTAPTIAAFLLMQHCRRNGLLG